MLRLERVCHAFKPIEPLELQLDENTDYELEKDRAGSHGPNLWRHLGGIEQGLPDKQSIKHL